VYLCAFCGSQNKQLLFPYTTLTDWFLEPRRSLFTARYGLDLYNSFLYNHLKSSGYYMYHQFNVHKFYVLPTLCVFMCFVWISEQTAIISLYNINWLVFITDEECVYCAVRSDPLSIIQVDFHLESPVVTICTTSLTLTNSTFCPHTVFMFLCGSENKQRLFPYTALTDRF